ncbi:MAG: nicotinate-nucleotide adenylyltransferase [Lysobacteraceae bacterium]
MIRILYGGTFDPVHNGHLAVADAAASLFDSDVVLLPSADPPHRAPPGASADQRAALLDLAVQGHPRLHVDRRELHRLGPSYSIDTLKEVRSEIGPEAPLAWLLGVDAFRGLHQWHRWRELFAQAHFVVAVRPGHALDSLDQELQAAIASRWIDDPAMLCETPSGRLLRLDLPLRFEAASHLRQRIAAGLPWDNAVPPAVAASIRAQRLYATGET